MKNLYSLDKYLRVTMSIFLFYYSGAVLNIYFFIATALLFTAITGFCPIYRIFSINKNYAKKLEHLAQLPNNNPEPIFIFNHIGKIIYQNDSSKKILPNIKEFNSITDKTPADIIKKEEINSIKFKQDDSTYLLNTKGIRDKDTILIYGFDITPLEKHTQELEFMNLTDALTKLHNRKKLLEDIYKLKDKNLALFIIDIKEFNQINSFFGHLRADKFLNEFANELKNYASQQLIKPSLYRLQANSFGLLFDFKNFDLNTHDYNITIIKKSVFSYFEKIEIKTIKVNITFDIRVGAATKCECHDDVDNISIKLLNQAEIAISEAKKRHLNYLEFKEISNMTEIYKENLEWAKKLKDIFSGKDDAKIVSYFQPIYNLKTKQIEKFETLVRIKDKNEVISPFKFLDIAKQIDFLPLITKEMLQQSLKKFKDSKYEFSINISHQDLRNKKLISSFVSELKNSDFPTNKIVLEILEDENIYDFIDVIHELKEAGFKIAIDDFGIGYSNFQKLQKLNADYLKIDGSLVKNIANNPKDLIIMNSICAYAKTIGVKTIAEFVADIEIFELVKKSGVDYAQGYYIGAPNPDLKVEFNG